jgi:hypothetical protein
MPVKYSRKNEMYRVFSSVVLMFMLWWSMLLFGGAIASRAQTANLVIAGPAVSLITETTAVISWSTSELSTSVVHFGKTESMGQVFRKIIPMEETEVMELNHAMTLWELEPGTVYHYRVRSVTASGSVAESGVLTFKTQSSVPECDQDIWSCGEWSECSPDGLHQRSCSLKDDCPTADTPKPEEKGECTYEKPVADVSDTTEKEDAAPELYSDTKEENQAETEKDGLVPDSPPPVRIVEPVEKVEPVEVDADDKDDVAAGLAPAEIEESEENGDEEDGGDEITEEKQEEVREKARIVESVMREKSSSEKMTDGMRQECGDAGVSEEMCYEWTAIKVSDKSCLEAGKTTVESCEQHLSEKGEGVFPGCEGLTDAECESVKHSSMVGYMSEDERGHVEEVLAEAVSKKTMIAMTHVIPVREDRSEGKRWKESVADEGADTSSVVIVEDADGDGLPDSLEIALGSDPDSADSDGDGVSDAEEAAAGSDPTGAGELERELTVVEKLFAENKPVGQPRGQGETDETLAVEEATLGETDSNGKGVVLSGKCDPNSVCLVYVYSYVPMVYVASTDEIGNFTVNLGDHILDGDHTVYVALTDDTGRVTRKSSPLSFFVREASAVSEDEFLNPFAVQEEGLRSDEAVSRYKLGYIVGVAFLVVLSIIALFLISTKKKGGSVV